MRQPKPRKHHYATRYPAGGPKKGSVLRGVALMMLKGTTAQELADAGLVPTKHGMGSVLPALEYNHGYDVRVFYLNNKRPAHYQIVGKYSKFSTRYRSFLKDKHYQTEDE